MTIVLDNKEKYSDELFHDNRPIMDVAVGNDLTGLSITKEEIENVIQNSKKKKTKQLAQMKFSQNCLCFWMNKVL